MYRFYHKRRLLAAVSLLVAWLAGARAHTVWAQGASNPWIPYSGITAYPDCVKDDPVAGGSLLSMPAQGVQLPEPQFTAPPELGGSPAQGFGLPVLGTPQPCEPVRTGWRWTFMPQGFLYHTYYASAAEPRLSSEIFSEQQTGTTYLDSCIGGRVGIVRFGERYVDEGIQLDILAGAKLRQNVDVGMDMTGTDYRFDIPLTYRKGQHAWKFGFYHISSHAGDEFLLKNPAFNRLNYYRNCMYLGYSYYVIPELRLYAEADYGFDTDIAQPWNFQFGFDYGPAYPTGIHGHPFIAMNGHLRQELKYGGNFNMELGWAWRGEALYAGTLRTGPYYYNGGSPQFSFYQQYEQQLGWGVWYDF
jgi:hypothetical protein